MRVTYIIPLTDLVLIQCPIVNDLKVNSQIFISLGLVAIVSSTDFIDESKIISYSWHDFEPCRILSK